MALTRHLRNEKDQSYDIRIDCWRGLEEKETRRQRILSIQINSGGNIDLSEEARERAKEHQINPAPKFTSYKLVTGRARIYTNIKSFSIPGIVTNTWKRVRPL